ncbi:PepSY domain-containing protein [Neobacillus niacini]|uniref:PepSY domain-containing protein n=1 Tax=Neobacillus niacini TaxID=86668 RepID=UPI0030021CD6
MKRISWFWMAICSLLIIILFVSWQQYGKLTHSAAILTEHEAEKLVQERYQGKVSLIKLGNLEYHIELEKQGHLYLIKLDAESGKVLSFAQADSTPLTPTQPLKVELSEEDIKKIVLTAVNGSLVSLEKINNNQEFSYKAIVNGADKQTTIVVDAFSGTILSSTTTVINQPPKRLTENEAVQIASTRVQGEVDDIWLETENNQTYYFVKIETKDDREATVQIHAITGEVKTVTWDDHESKKNEKGKDDD